MKRGGFSVAEVMVSLLLATSLLVILWSFYQADQKRFYVDQNRLSGLQGVLLLDEYLTTDLHEAASSLEASPGGPVTLLDGGRGIRFRTFRKPTPTTGSIPTVEVLYAFDPLSHRITRTCDGESRAIPSLVLENVQFSLFTPRLALEKLGPGFPGVVYGAHDPPLMVKYVLTGVSETYLESPQQLDHERVSLVGAIPVMHRRALHHHPYWIPSLAEALDTP